MNDARFADFTADAICGMLANVGDALHARIRSFAEASGSSPVRNGKPRQDVAARN